MNAAEHSWSITVKMNAAEHIMSRRNTGLSRSQRPMSMVESPDVLRPPPGVGDRLQMSRSVSEISLRRTSLSLPLPTVTPVTNFKVRLLL